eukprot:sb/3468849/
MGLISTSLNTVSLIRSAWELPQQKSYEMFLNKSAIVLINLGDLMIGIYLLLLSYFDFIYNSNGNYCEEIYQWFSSSECSFLGVLSTTGSQLSLFAMTMLSITRLANIGNLIQRDLFSYKSAVRLVVLLAFPLLASVLIAVTPILPITEDYFVNGIYYSSGPPVRSTTTRFSKNTLKGGHCHGRKPRSPGKLSAQLSKKCFHQIRHLIHQEYRCLPSIFMVMMVYVSSSILLPVTIPKGCFQHPFFW